MHDCTNGMRKAPAKATPLQPLYLHNEQYREQCYGWYTCTLLRTEETLPVRCSSLLQFQQPFSMCVFAAIITGSGRTSVSSSSFWFIFPLFLCCRSCDYSLSLLTIYLHCTRAVRTVQIHTNLANEWYVYEAQEDRSCNNVLLSWIMMLALAPATTCMAVQYGHAYWRCINTAR